MAATAAVLLGGAILNAWSAEAPAATNTSPAEIPEPTSESLVVKKPKKPKSASKPKAGQSAAAAKPVPGGMAGKEPVGPEPVSPPSAGQGGEQPKSSAGASVAKSPPASEAPAPPAASEKPKPAAEPSIATTRAGPPPASQPIVEAERPEPAAPAQIAGNAGNNWNVGVSYDDYQYKAPINEGSGGNQSGNLYGFSLRFAPPSWHERTFFDVSFRQGFLHGSTLYTPLPSSMIASSFDTLVNEVFVGFHFDVLPWIHKGKERGHMITYAGLSWDGWSTTETLIGGRIWPTTGVPTLQTDRNMVLGNLGLGYDLVLWHPTSNVLSYKLGVKVEGIGAMGGSNFNAQGGDQIDSLAVYGLARGAVYMDLSLRNHVAVFVEGGYQRSWWLFSENAPRNAGVNNFEGYWGGFGRVGLDVRF